MPAAAGASRARRNIVRSRGGAIVRAALRGSTAGAVVRATALSGILALDPNTTIDGVVDDVGAEEEGLANDPLVTSVDWWRGAGGEVVVSKRPRSRSWLAPEARYSRPNMAETQPPPSRGVALVGPSMTTFALPN